MTVSRLLPALIVPIILAMLGACTSTTQQGGRTVGSFPPHGTRQADQAATHPELPKAGSGRGGYYKDDGPGDAAPANLHSVPDAEVRAEPYSRYANRPYVVFGKRYVPMLDDQPFVQRGMSSWYGKKFHGQKTASGEIYDMYKMTAAHPTLPIPSYARITSSDTGAQVVVRINDRGPFHAGRIVDVSYTAALKLGLLQRGAGRVTVERILPSGALERLGTTRRNAPEPDPVTANLSTPSDVSALLLESKAEVKAIKAHPEAAPEGEDAAPAPAEAFYVQLGAFSGAAKADEVRSRATGQGGFAGALEVVRSGALHRVLSGPFETRAAAQEAARSVPASLRLRPIVVKR